MIRELFHGSAIVVHQPEFGKGKPYNDYGLGFYCTEILDMAKEWSVGKNRDGFVNRYEIDCEGLEILNLDSADYCVLHWLSVLLQNRTFDTTSSLAAEAKEYLTTTFAVGYKNTDIITGYRADDSYFSYAQDFINGTISYRQLGNAMRLGKLGQQFVLKSKKSFERIRFLGSEHVSSEEWYSRKMSRDSVARKEYFSVEKSRRQRGDLYIAQILDEEMSPNDARLQ